MNRNFKEEIIAFLKAIAAKQHFQLEKDLANNAYVDVFFDDLKCGLIFHSLTDTVQKPIFNRPGNSIRLVHIWEDQWLFHNAKIRSKILSLLGQTNRIHGRKTSVIKIDNSQLIEFLKENHLNVPIKAKYKYGLIKDADVLAVMSFSKSRQIERDHDTFNSFELLRFCNKLNTTVVGGFSKLLQHFIKLHNPDDIMTYIDGDWSDGQNYLAMGFELATQMPPLEFWLNTKTGEREYPHLVLKKYKLSEFNDETDKSAFLEKMNYRIIFNAISYKFLLKRK